MFSSKLRVLSLFDGISCGMVALQRAGIPVEKYTAYEIDKYAIEISKKNYPQIERHGDVIGADFAYHKGFDLLIGGSPCQDLSCAGTRTGLNGSRSSLFFEYVRALEEAQPTYFLFENVASMKKEVKGIISAELGVEPIMINSSNLSAQQRKRLYWTNIPNVTQPEDKGILLQDILEDGIAYSSKSYCITASYKYGISFERDFKRSSRTGVAQPVKGGALRTRTNADGVSGKHIEIRQDDKANCLTSAISDSMVSIPVRVGAIENRNYQGYRVYSVRGKSISLSATSGGFGGKTGLYKIDLPDGDYYIRKLTPIECERLQTLPDNYTAGVSNTQRYKMLGNGWTVDVIAHILRAMNNNKKETKEIKENGTINN